MREQDGERGEEPSHHARRPMNAFLIFCKRHRAVVRDKYPNLENRSITKILGEWWANLEEEEKSCYTGLAKQYKDAFFNANPDFKWYKLPAPPLRMLSARPAPSAPAAPAAPSTPAAPAAPRHPHPDPLATNNNSTKYDYNRKLGHVFEDTPLSMFTPGKLADEAHMGGLSSLISSNQPEPASYVSRLPTSTPVPEGFGSDVVYPYDRSQHGPKSRSQEDNIRELQNALSETTRIFKDFDDTPKHGTYDNNNRTLHDNNFTNQEIIDEIVNRRLLKETLKEDQNSADYTESEKVIRYGRSCKGKRYQEFMSVGGLLVNKRLKRDDNPEEYNASCSWEYSESPPDDSRHGYRKTDNETYPEMETRERRESEPNDSKPFKPADFDLDAKIKALPSLSLERFQEKKRENKKKKRSNFSVKPKERPALPGWGDGRENWRRAVIGSQKRKPRKISITRLEVNSMVNRTGEVKISPEIKIATEAPPTRDHSMELSRHGRGPEADLFALTTLAEVAANTSKLQQPSAV